MLKVYYANQLRDHKDLLVGILENDPNPDPFSQETILVQSIGMAQWLQMEIAQKMGISANIAFPFPTSFVWQQYRTLFPELPKENIFSPSSTVWRFMRLIPKLLSHPSLSPLARYLAEGDQLKLYQLATKIADIFDQYLVYRPQWLIHWEQGENQHILNAITQNSSLKIQAHAELENAIQWQGMLWNALIADIRQDTAEEIFHTSHRAYLQHRYFEKLANLSDLELKKLPKRVFVFGISSLPPSQLAVLKKLSEYITVHLFFTNPSQEYWGDQQDERMLEKLALKQQISSEEMQEYAKGNPLLAVWGKQGKEFFNLLEELEPLINEPRLFDDFTGKYSLLANVKRAILYNQPEFDETLNEHEIPSLQIHACHSKMREVEVLHNRLLAMFEQDPQLSPKDIIVMSPDIDSYAPYINAVFARFQRSDNRYIPFSLSDQKISHVDPVVASFLNLLSFKEKTFSVEEILDLLNVAAIRTKYQISEEQLLQLQEWITSVGIRAGLQQDNPSWQNYNSWENGIARLLLGTALKEENNPWQNVLGFDESYGLNADLTGNFAHFLENLTAWHMQLQTAHTAKQWQAMLLNLLTQFYSEEHEQIDSVLVLQHSIKAVMEPILQTEFNEPLATEIILQLFESRFHDTRSSLNFMVGHVNFCTLLPMRAIPFKVVCLLGMNEGEFPRQQMSNSFDLMQYAHQKGDRARRDDDRYLFLESLLSAQQVFYISYIGQSLTDNQEKLPSILVSQLLDYLSSQLSDSQVQQYLYRHPMTVFSPNNFIDGAISYDVEWLQAKHQPQAINDFSEPIARDFVDLPNEIELDDLISYVQDPVKFFFNRQLGIRFEQHEYAPEPHEVFELSKLDEYQLLNKLVEIKPCDHAQYIENTKLKGKLPYGYFGELATQDMNEKVHMLQIALADYLGKEKNLLEIDYPQGIRLPNGETYQIRVQGYIQNCFEQQQIVQWRVGRLRDKDLIRAWLNYLFLIVTQENNVPFRFYFFDKKVQCLRFTTLDKSQAADLIQIYLQDYFANFGQLTTALTSDLKGYFKTLSEGDENELDLTLLEKCLNDSSNPYWYRVVAQTAVPDFNAIHQRTLRWFELMIRSQEIQ